MSAIHFSTQARTAPSLPVKHAGPTPTTTKCYAVMKQALICCGSFATGIALGTCITILTGLPVAATITVTACVTLGIAYYCANKTASTSAQVPPKKKSSKPEHKPHSPRKRVPSPRTQPKMSSHSSGAPVATQQITPPLPSNDEATNLQAIDRLFTEYAAWMQQTAMSLIHRPLPPEIIADQLKRYQTQSEHIIKRHAAHDSAAEFNTRLLTPIYHQLYSEESQKSFKDVCLKLAPPKPIASSSQAPAADLREVRTHIRHYHMDADPLRLDAAYGAMVETLNTKKLKALQRKLIAQHGQEHTDLISQILQSPDVLGPNFENHRALLTGRALDSMERRINRGLAQKKDLATVLLQFKTQLPASSRPYTQSLPPSATSPNETRARFHKAQMIQGLKERQGQSTKDSHLQVLVASAMDPANPWTSADKGINRAVKTLSNPPKKKSKPSTDVN